MTKKRFEKEMRYQVMLSICRSMTAQGVLSKDDAVWTERFLREKYQPIFETHI